MLFVSIFYLFPDCHDVSTQEILMTNKVTELTIQHIWDTFSQHILPNIN